MRMETFSRSQILQDFNFQCSKLASNNNRGFKQAFRQELNDVGKDLPSRAGSSEANREKNRYHCILPYDHCRVRLSVQNQNPNSDYINANFVPGGGSERDFICTQGPISNTLADFWRMVWEQNVRIIIMVTALREKNTVLCEKYWSLEEGTVYHGLFQITTVTRKQGPDYFVTTINLRQRDLPNDRIITHYYYPSWPDQKVPNPFSLCVFTEHVRQHLEALPCLGPAVVHCSAGIGRSGTFVTLLWLMQLSMRGIPPDIKGAVRDLRLHRMSMVQTLDQYIFIHHCLLHWLSGGASASRQQMQVPDLNSNQHKKDQPPSSRRRRQRHSSQHKPPADQPQNTLQQIFKPGNLLRRLIPSLSQMNPNSQNA
ncbi:receptor-type tyrosine-protein phosphatase V-like isoform X1 [Xiphophorus couchianus]|uniref:receptor-type tyrosine-protein phosphatase V-like isoform X1 n=1 Tax=Xiphophorus couchianus TaxID=32473 RepID=UPI00101714E7|nr:receptor-type tyrosine-protein phosphatase V-like isoform X1 [Xiphophorus couchianus]XP_027881046.1 receptor-type tyrosine-protein phosphatase V-like isoform X1 [Xiphophorus couchianus]